MHEIDSLNVAVLLLALAALLGTARLLGEVARRLHQPAVVGELLAGVLLGPTVFGALAPSWSVWLFPRTGANAVALDTVSTLAIVLFLLVAGMEVDLSTVWRQGKTALKVALLAVSLPFVVGLAAGSIFPHLVGREDPADPLIFALFLATALSISALPVIAKTLLDLDLYRSDLGMVIVSAAVLNDVIGWTVFAMILGMLETFSAQPLGIAGTVVAALALAVGALTVGRWLVHRALPWIQAYTQGPGGVLSFALTLALAGAALTEWIGIHAIFGAFLIGVAIGDSSHLREHTRTTIDQFASFIFAPLFFASIGLHVDFVQHFDARLLSIVLAIACVSKLLGATLGARWGGMPRREAWAVGFALNARGAMEIILGLLALEAGLIQQPLFVALVVTALVTSMMSGPAMRQILGLRRPQRLVHYLSPRHFVRRFHGHTRRDAIRELTELLCHHKGLDLEATFDAVWAREAEVATGLGRGVALPHALIEPLAEPLVAVGLSEVGLDFDAPDGQPAHVVFLILTPGDSPHVQFELAAEIAQRFRDPEMLERTLRARNFTEWRALVCAAS